MSNFNLFSILPEEDRTKIWNYTSRYGFPHDKYRAPLEDWLHYWGKEKIKLYKLLGKQLTYSFDYKYRMSNGDRFSNLRDKIEGHPFVYQWREFVQNFIRNKLIQFEGSSAIKKTGPFYTLVEPHILFADLAGFNYSCKENGKSLVINSKMKPMRAIQKIIKYFEGQHSFDLSAFEKFRIAHSQAYNTKDGIYHVTLSIHPLDYITMSDNSNDWSSCMQWTDDRGPGCYRLGTVEMMNSNNVLIAYVTGKEQFFFGDTTKDTDIKNYTWNSKHWRQLFYINKDIIVGGKAYPSYNRDLTQRIISELRLLAHKNLKWDYEFGVEPYQDMIHLNSQRGMMHIREHIRTKDYSKKNIVFDTKAMYNDMLNDNDTIYWCVRNKVPHTKMISYSGKAPCLCCLGDVTYPLSNYEADNMYYNERYENNNEVICEDCKDKYTCSECGKIPSDVEKIHKIHVRGLIESSAKSLCQDCFNKKVKICPKCNKPMYLKTVNVGSFYIKDKEDVHKHLFCCESCYYEMKEDDTIKFEYLQNMKINLPMVSKDFPYTNYTLENLKQASDDTTEVVMAKH